MGGRFSGVTLILKLLGRDLGWSLLTGDFYSKVVVRAGMTALSKTRTFENRI